MKYFVCAENNTYNHWQLELLISSFQKLNLENDLYIALYDSKVENTVRYYNKIPKHKNVFFFRNEGTQEKNELLALFSLRETLASGPIVVIEPDFVIVSPFRSFQEDVVFQIDYNYSFEAQSENVKIYQEKIAAKGAWIPIGSTKAFKDINLIQFAVSWGNFLNDYRAGWVFAIIENNLTFKELPCEYSLLDSLGDKETGLPFVHYNQGFPPSFHKKMFLCSKEAPIMLDSSPFRALMRETPSTASAYVAKLSQAYLEEFRI